MNLTVSEVIDLCEALSIGLRAAKDSHTATDAQVERILKAYEMLYEKQFTDPRTPAEVNASFMENCVKECATRGCD